MANTKKFSHERLEELGVAWKVTHPVVFREFLQQRRWETDYRVIFEDDGALWEIIISEGSTEMQESEPFGFEDPVTLKRVKPFERTVIDYCVIED